MKKISLITMLAFFTAISHTTNANDSTEVLTREELKGINYIEVATNVELGFEAAKYLPADFNPYAAPVNFMDVSFIKEETESVLGFDTSLYLPEDFDPYKAYGSAAHFEM